MSIRTLNTAEARQLLNSGKPVGAIRLTADTIAALEAEGFDLFKAMGWGQRALKCQPAQRASGPKHSTPPAPPDDSNTVIRELCAIAGRPDAAAGFIARNTSPHDVRQALLAGLDKSPAIFAAEQTPAVQEATRRAAEYERLHGKAVAPFGRPQVESDQQGNVQSADAKHRTAAQRSAA